MTKYADLVIGPDTGLLNAASCFDTPKIVFMSAGSIENLCKHWNNTTALWAEDCECYPCHRLIHTNSCPQGTIQGIAPKCMEHLKPEKVLMAIKKVYDAWMCKQADKLNELKFAAFTIADSTVTHALAKRVKTSFQKFHPDIPFYSFDPKDELTLLGERKTAACMCDAFAIRPRLAEYLLKDFDCVIYLDADTVVTHRLDEFLKADYDVAGSLNIAGEERRFCNAGVAAITSPQFCREWSDLVYRPDTGKSNQVAFNDIAHSGRYTFKVVDEKDVYYNETSREYWKDLKVEGDKLYCNSRLVKVLHWAGGAHKLGNKFSSADFSQEVREFLDRVTDTTDFTTIRGEEVSAWKLGKR